MNTTAMLLGTLIGAAMLTAAYAADSGDVTEHAEVRGALALLDRWIDAHQAYERVPGISVGVVLDRDVIWRRGYGHGNVTAVIRHGLRMTRAR